MMPRTRISSPVRPPNPLPGHRRRIPLAWLIIGLCLCIPAYGATKDKPRVDAAGASSTANSPQAGAPVAGAPEAQTAETASGGQPASVSPPSEPGPTAVEAPTETAGSGGSPVATDVPAVTRTDTAIPPEPGATVQIVPGRVAYLLNASEKLAAVTSNIRELEQQLRLATITSTLTLVALIALLTFLAVAKFAGRMQRKTGEAPISVDRSPGNTRDHEHQALSRQLDRTSTCFNDFEKALKDVNVHLRQVLTTSSRPASSQTMPDSYLKSDVDVLQKLFVLSSNIRGSNLTTEEYARKVFAVIASTKRDAGIYLITPNQGDSFDVNLHEGTPVENDNVPKGRIVRLLSPGLRVEDHVVEFAKVAYAR